MRIAQVAPLCESVPPRFYGGTERVVSYLTEELIRQGHEVTLFASGDSRTAARLVSPCSQALRLGPRTEDATAYHVYMLELLMREIEEFDVVHAHIDYLPWPLFRREGTRALTTLHGRLDLPELLPLFREFDRMPLASISDAQREPVLWANWIGTVHHGLPKDQFPYNSKKGSYLAFLGRISIEKRVDRAVEIARRVGMRLRVAAKVDPRDQAYYTAVAEPLLKDPWCDFVGEIGEAAKGDFLGNAYALLFPIDWPEPFGMVMIEAMACGTPVIAYRAGSVSEIIEDGVTGFLVDSLDAAVEAVRRVETLSRERIRSEFERRFSVERMARDYVKLYKRLLEPESVLPELPPEGRALGVQA